MSSYTVPPNGYEPYHGQAQGQAYPPHQESTVPQQEHHQYNPAAHPYSEPGFAGAASDYPPPYSEQPPQNYPRSEYPPQVSNQEHGYASYPPNPEKGSGENASYYTGGTQDQANGVNTGPGVGPEGEGERGLGSTLLGGAAGGYAGHKMQGGFLGTAGGAVLGAVGMNMVSHEIKDHKRHEEERRYAEQYGPGYGPGSGEGYGPPGGHGHLHHGHEHGRGRGRGRGLMRGRGRGRGH